MAAMTPSSTTWGAARLLEIPNRVDGLDSRIVSLEAEVELLTDKLQTTQAELHKIKASHTDILKTFDGRVEHALEEILTRIDPRMAVRIAKQRNGESAGRDLQWGPGSITAQKLVATPSPTRGNAPATPTSSSPAKPKNASAPPMAIGRYGIEASLKKLKGPSVPKLDMQTLKARSPTIVPARVEANADAAAAEAEGEFTPAPPDDATKEAALLLSEVIAHVDSPKSPSSRSTTASSSRRTPSAANGLPHGAQKSFGSPLKRGFSAGGTSTGSPASGGSLHGSPSQQRLALRLSRRAVVSKSGWAALAKQLPVKRDEKAQRTALFDFIDSDGEGRIGPDLMATGLKRIFASNKGDEAAEAAIPLCMPALERAFRKCNHTRDVWDGRTKANGSETSGTADSTPALESKCHPVERKEFRLLLLCTRPLRTGASAVALCSP